VLATLAIVFTLSVIVTMRMPRLYRATSVVAVFPENQNSLGFKDVDSNYSDSDNDLVLQTQALILSSDTLALRVIDTLHLAQDPKFTGTESIPVATQTSQAARAEADEARTAALLRVFHRGLKIDMIPRTRIISVAYTHRDPHLATAIVNTLISAFIEENFKTKYESVTQTSDWLSRQLEDLQLKVETSQEKLVRYQKEHSILGIDEKQNIVTAKLDELNRQLTLAEADRIEKESNYKFAMSGDPALAENFSPEESALLGRLREREADINTQYAQLTTQFGPGYPKVAELSNQLKQVRAEIAAEQVRLQRRLRDAYLTAMQREKLLTKAFDQQKQEANGLNESAIEYSALKRDADSNHQLYEGLLQKLKEAGITAGMRSNNIRVVDTAKTPISPVSPNIPRNLIFGLLLGLGGGIGLAFVLENLDTTVRNMEEIAAICSLPGLAVIPKNGRLRKQLTTILPLTGKSESLALITYARPNSQSAESFRAFRTSLMLSAIDTPPKVILVTSPMPQEGKSTISANLALVMAQRGSRVLLVDADLRRPGIANIFGLNSDCGLSTLISGVDKLSEVVTPIPEIPNLNILPAGPIPPQPAELLASDSMKGYLARWREQFDHIIVDTPPCLSVTDAVLLSPEADGVIIVVRAQQTTKAALRRACDVLLQVNAHITGVVLNDYDMGSPDSYYHAYGNRYSGYYTEAD
jgi:capsular exopolysaccharide synthesis family protein